MESSIYPIFYIQRVKVRAIPYPRQPLTKWGNTVSVAKAVMTPLASSAAFATGQNIVFVYLSVSCDLFYITFIFFYYSNFKRYRSDEY